MFLRYVASLSSSIYAGKPLDQIFKHATEFFSRGDKSLNLAMVIPSMDHIDEHLASDATNGQCSASIQAALLMGKQTLNRYYNLTDHSEVYHIAMSES